jgi:hypothetical protein
MPIPNAGIMSLKVAKRTVMYVLIFFFGWFPAVITSIYEFAYGPVIEELDTALATMGSLHSVLVPIVYGYMNPRLRKVIWALCCCQDTRVAQASSVSDHTRNTRIKSENSTEHTQNTLAITVNNEKNLVVRKLTKAQVSKQSQSPGRKSSPVRKGQAYHEPSPKGYRRESHSNNNNSPDLEPARERQTSLALTAIADEHLPGSVPQSEEAKFQTARSGATSPSGDRESVTTSAVSPTPPLYHNQVPRRISTHTPTNNDLTSPS